MSRDPLFCDTDLARRVDLSDMDAMRCAIAAVRASRPGETVFCEEVAGGLATFAGAGSPYNKVLGLGFDGGHDERAIASIEARYAEAGSPVTVELSALASPDVGELLTGRGYRLIGVEHVLGARLPAPTIAAAGGVQVGHCAQDRYKDWLDALIDGFLDLDGTGADPHETFNRETLESAIGDASRDPKMHRFIAHIDGREHAAGGASVRIDGPFATMCGASTRPAERRRGVQTALLGERLRFAAERGCEIALLTTNPGSRSQANAMKQGFGLLFARNVLVKDTVAGA